VVEVRAARDGQPALWGIAPKALRIDLDVMSTRWLRRAEAMGAGVEAVRSGQPWCSCRLVFLREAVASLFSPAGVEDIGKRAGLP